MRLWREKNGKRYRNFIFFFGNLKIEKRPENEREKRPAHEGPARGVRIHILNWKKDILGVGLKTEKNVVSLYISYVGARFLKKKVNSISITG